MRRPNTPTSRISRRSFLTTAAALAGAASTRDVLAGGRHARQQASASDRVALAIVGAGGRGADNIREAAAAGAEIVALCDCDEQNAAESFAKYPDARRYRDWRRMLDAEKGIDAVLVATPDHSHAIVSIAAMQLGKHVYCEKPLARSIWEARQMAQAATASRVATQMGTQGHAYEGTRRAVEVLRAGLIGEVTELHVWTDRPATLWAQGVLRPTDTPPVPPTLDWDVWLGPAPERPYHPAYVPFKWRGFWDFGTGAIGDMGIHNLDTAYWGLELGAPTSRARPRLLAGYWRSRDQRDGAALEHHRAPVSRAWQSAAREHDVVRRRQAAAAGVVPGSEAHHQGRRFPRHRQQGHALHAHVARRRE